MKSYFAKGFTQHGNAKRELIKRAGLIGNKKNGAGFTLIELLVCASIIVMILSFVLANFKTSSYSSELDLVMKQITSAVSSVRNKSLAGEIMQNPTPPPEQIFPEGGYEIYLQAPTNSAVSYSLFAVLQSGTEIALPNSTKTFPEIEFFNPDNPNQLGFVATTVEVVDGRLGETCYIGNWLKIIFTESGVITVDYPTSCGEEGEIKYVGGFFRHKQTGQKAYFYVSLLSGLVTGSQIYE